VQEGSQESSRATEYVRLAGSSNFALCIPTARDKPGTQGCVRHSMHGKCWCRAYHFTWRRRPQLIPHLLHPASSHNHQEELVGSTRKAASGHLWLWVGSCQLRESPAKDHQVGLCFWCKKVRHKQLLFHSRDLHSRLRVPNPSMVATLSLGMLPFQPSDRCLDLPGRTKRWCSYHQGQPFTLTYRNGLQWE